MPTILVRCPCGRRFTVTEALVGTWLRCSDCGQMTFITWPKTRARPEPTAADIPPDEHLFEEPPEAAAIEEIVAAEHERPPKALMARRCIGCGRTLKPGPTVVERVSQGLRGLMSYGGGAAQVRRPGRQTLCRRCQAAQRGAAATRAKMTAGKPVRIRRVAKPRRSPAMVAAVVNFPVLVLTVAVAQFALSEEDPLAAVGAILLALVPVVTVQSAAIYGVGRLVRVRDIGAEPAAHAAVLAAGLQVVIGGLGYVAALTGAAIGAPQAATGIMAVTAAVMVLLSLRVFTRILQIGLIRALILTAAAAAVLGAAALVMEPVGRVVSEWVPEGLFPTSQPATSRPAESAVGNSSSTRSSFRGVP